MPDRPLAVVTGASSGIGYELARIAAENGYDLVIAADRDLDEASGKLRAMGASVDAIETDLSTREGVDRLQAAVGGRDVDVLCANAGHGLGGAFLDQDFEEIRHVIDTNVTGTAYLLQKFAREMRNRDRGRILITGSVAGYLPGSFHAVYNATKAFVDSFAWALRNELRDSDVTVTLLMPGVTDTEFFERARMEDTRFGTSKKDDPAFVAQAGWEAMMKGEGDVVAGWKNKLMASAANVAPAGVSAEVHRRMAAPGTGRRQSSRHAATGDGAERDGTGVKLLLGAAAGAAGVWALDRTDWFMWNHEDLDSRASTIKARPRQLPPAENMVSAIQSALGIELSRPMFEAASQIVHYSIGVAPAVGYALLRDRMPSNATARGALYGFGMFLAQDEVLNTVTGLGAKPQDYPWQAHARGLVAHLAYGLATEFALNLLEGLTGTGEERRSGAAMPTKGEKRPHVLH